MSYPMFHPGDLVGVNAFFEEERLGLVVGVEDVNGFKVYHVIDSFCRLRTWTSSKLVLKHRRWART